MQAKTKLIHCARGDKDLLARPVNPPLMRASTILFKDHATWEHYKDIRHKQRVLSYGARGTTTNFELENLICELEGAHRAQLFPTGLAALAMVLLNYASKASHFIITRGIYPPVKGICEQFLQKIGVEIDFISPDASDVIHKIKSNTKLILCESPSSILYDIIDLPKLCDIAHKHNIPVAIDNTYSSGYLLNPLTLGVDISVIAATKYLGGHSDITMGIVAVNQKEWSNFDKLPEIFGFSASPDDAYLVLRGARTLDIRMKSHEQNAKEVIAYLQTRKEIIKIFYPALDSHCNHDIFLRDHKGANGMVTIEFSKNYTKRDIMAFVDSLSYFGIGASWGGYESLVTIATPMIEGIESRGVFVRFSIGLEDVRDLIDDLEHALNLLDSSR